MPYFSLREKIKGELAKGLDLLVIGGGINGAGILRDARLRGLNAGLVEKNDFASGASSRSSKLIHGGLRYLEHMDFSLVFESCRERTLLARLLPDLVRPTPFLFPIYKTDRIPLFFMDLGLWLYDTLALFRNFKLHRKVSAKEALEMEPGLNPKGLTGALLYYDAKVNDAELVMRNVTDALAQGAHPLNYAEVISVEKKDGRVCAAVVRDGIADETFTVPCKALICACGPWSNRMFELIEGRKRDLLRLTKGIHLVVPAERLPVKSAVVVNSNTDKRIIFIIPWEGRTLIGTTDTDYHGDIDAVYPDKSDVESVLALVNGVFPGLNLRAGESVSAFAGLRPLVLEKGGASTVSRKDRIFRGDSGAYFIGGGKLTTYRNMAEKAVDRVVRETSVTAGPCRTRTLPLVQNRPAIDEFIRANPVLAEKIVPGLPTCYAEIPFAAKHALLASITDFFRLRTDIFLKSADNGMAALDRCASLLGEALGLDPEAVREQAAAYREWVENNNGPLGSGRSS